MNLYVLQFISFNTRSTFLFHRHLHHHLRAFILKSMSSLCSLRVYIPNGMKLFRCMYRFQFMYTIRLQGVSIPPSLSIIQPLVLVVLISRIISIHLVNHAACDIPMRCSLLGYWDEVSEGVVSPLQGVVWIIMPTQRLHFPQLFIYRFFQNIFIYVHNELF